MFFKKLFSKDYRYYEEKGDRFLHEERYADARDAFTEAMQKIAECGTEDVSLCASIREKLARTGNGLGALNLTEAEHALNSGNITKAEDHLRIVMALAEDVMLREKAENYLEGVAANTSSHVRHEMNHSCSGCVTESGQTSHNSHVMDDRLATEDRFELYVQTLPDDLPGRYAALGEKFAYACLLNRDGDGEAALKVFEELSAEEENDILDYEMALIYYRNGDPAHCEKLLRRALGMNGSNLLCYVGLVQLLSETERAGETIAILDHMIEMQLHPDHARMMLGDVRLILDDEEAALDNYSKLLASPMFAREAAEKVIPLLEKQGRQEEAAYLAKQFAKGCR